eukprot:gene15136-21193_t
MPLACLEEAGGGISAAWRARGTRGFSRSSEEKRPYGSWRRLNSYVGSVSAEFRRHSVNGQTIYVLDAVQRMKKVIQMPGRKQAPQANKAAKTKLAELIKEQAMAEAK